MKFWKLHANGNDFILMHTHKKHSPRQIKRICHRNFGIGADGILYVYVKKDIVYYEHFNQDGSKANMCGNGIRCVAYWYFQSFKKERVSVSINDTLYRLKGNGNFITLESPIPSILDETHYLMGVKHKIIEAYEEPIEYNMNKVSYQDELHFSLTTYEIGVGETLSCGSGTIVAYYHGILHHGLYKVAISKSKGGMNLLQLQNDCIFISTVVEKVFHGSIDLIL